MINVIRTQVSVVVRSGGTSAEFEGRDHRPLKLYGISEAHRLEMNAHCDDFWRARGIEPSNADWKNNRISF